MERKRKARIYIAIFRACFAVALATFLLGFAAILWHAFDKSDPRPIVRGGLLFILCIAAGLNLFSMLFKVAPRPLKNVFFMSKASIRGTEMARTWAIFSGKKQTLVFGEEAQKSALFGIIEKISPQLAAVGVVSTGTVLRSKNGGAH